MYPKLGVLCSVSGTLHIEDPLQHFEKSSDPGGGFPLFIS